MSTKVGIVMGSKSDGETMSSATEVLAQLGIPHEVKVMSAHRSPDLVHQWATGAEGRGLQVIIAAAGGAAHLAGVVAANTTLPVLGVPMKTSSLGGLDSLLSTVQMPWGIPVATFAIGNAGAANAALFAVAILARQDAAVREALGRFRKEQTEKVAREQDDLDGA